MKRRARASRYIERKEIQALNAPRVKSFPVILSLVHAHALRSTWMMIVFNRKKNKNWQLLASRSSYHPIKRIVFNFSSFLISRMNINCNKTRCLLFLFRCFFQDQSTLTTKKWIIPVLFLFFSFFWTTLEQGRKETNYRFLEGEPSNLEYKCERSQSWKFKMRHRRIDPPKNTLKARSYVIRDIYRRKEKKKKKKKKPRDPDPSRSR